MLKKMRRRYLALNLDCEEALSSRDFMSAVWAAFLKLYGEYGASKTALSLIEYDDEQKFAVLRTSHTTVDMVRAALASITRIEEKPVAVHVLKISGTIKALFKKMKM